MGQEKDATPEFWTPERCYITELMNTDDLPGVSLALARVTPGVQTQLHALRDVEEIYIVRAGRGLLEVDGAERSVAAGDQAVIPASASQRITNVGDDDLEFYCLCRPRFRPDCYVNLEFGDAAT